MNEISSNLDHFSTQLRLIGLKVDVLKCKFWSSSKIFLGINIPQNYTLVIDELHILGVPMGLQDFTMHFLDEVLSQNVVHIDDLPFLGNAQAVLGILSSCVACQPSYFTWTILPSCLFWRVSKGSYACMWGHYGSKIMGIFSRPLSKPSSSTTDILWWYKLFLYGRLCPICFSRELDFGGSIFVLYVLYFL
jgi:hypothetical protein